MKKTESERLQTLLEDLKDIGCPVMSAKLEALYRTPEFLNLDRLSLLSELISPQHEETMTGRINARLKRGKLEGCVAAVDSCRDSNERIYLPNGAVSILSQLNFVHDGQNLCIVGPSGSGKTYFAKALSVKACNKWRVLYAHCDDLLAQLLDAKRDSNKQYQKKLTSLANLDLLTLDDFLLQPTGSTMHTAVLFDLLERRCEKQHSTIVCAQRSPESWHAMMGEDVAISDAIVRRATMHYSVVIEMPPVD